MHAVLKSLHFFLAGMLVFTAITASVSAGSTMYKGYQTPDFTVSVSEGRFELRDYPPYLVAEVQVEGTRSSAIRRGFRALAGYIFGKNGEETKIAMTAPVTQAQTEDAWQVQFMIPDGFDLESLPIPDNDQVQFRKTNSETLAVVQFSGWWSDRNLAGKAQELRRWVDGQGLTVVDGPRYYFYDDPFTLPQRRRNEVAFRVQ